MQRRRFLTLAAAFACAPALARADTWQGRALGADVSVTLTGPRGMTRRALAEVPRLLTRIERAFSLHDPSSDLARLNSLGRLRAPDMLMRRLLAKADEAHRLTGGLFDPTVQPLWQAAATGGDVETARRAVGWNRVRVTPDLVELQTGQALTLNGIAQGFAADLMRRMLARHGARHALIDMGEQIALGGPFTLGLSDPVQGHLGTRTMTDMAVATSSPPALHLGRHSHILGPQGQAPLWSTVSIEAPSATLADALSTAACLMPIEALHRLKARARLHRITAIDDAGNLRTL